MVSFPRLALCALIVAGGPAHGQAPPALAPVAQTTPPPAQPVAASATSQNVATVPAHDAPVGKKIEPIVAPVMRKAPPALAGADARRAAAARANAASVPVLAAPAIPAPIGTAATTAPTQGTVAAAKGGKAATPAPSPPLATATAPGVASAAAAAPQANTPRAAKAGRLAKGSRSSLGRLPAVTCPPGQVLQAGLCAARKASAVVPTAVPSTTVRKAQRKPQPSPPRLTGSVFQSAGKALRPTR